jgi:formylglycine-generating enzyme required for sulfatase activity
MAWLERWLWGEEGGGARPGARRPEAVPAGSPLAALLGRAKAARARDAFGVEAGGVLAPETVPFRGLAVGRFEVTRAQWAEFDPAAAPAPGEEELPATGMPFERAREYAAWLAAKTGRPFRLPTAAEAEALAGAAENGGGGGNTLARWTGAAPNPEDGAAIAAALAEAAARLGRAAPLLLPVGSFPGTGDDPLFDLDGNAAEWAAGDDGAGVPAGPSADRADDPRGGESASDPAYVGLRVVADG